MNADEVLNTSLSGTNLYTYCANNPINYYDPDGHIRLLLSGLFGVSSSVLVPVLIVVSVIHIVAITADFIAQNIPQSSSTDVSSKPETTVEPVAVTPSPNKPNDDEFDKTIDRNTYNVNKGYSSFQKLKRAIGSAGKGNDWHHIVEQCQIRKSGFDVQMIQNEKNVIAISKKVHRKISGYYSSIPKDGSTGGLTVRNFLSGKSYQFQYEYGIKILKMFGGI